MNAKTVAFVELSPRMLCISIGFLLTEDLILLNMHIKISRITTNIGYTFQTTRGRKIETEREKKSMNPQKRQERRKNILEKWDKENRGRW